MDIQYVADVEVSLIFTPLNGIEEVLFCIIAKVGFIRNMSSYWHGGS